MGVRGIPQIKVLSQNQSFSGPTEIPNSFQIPKNNFDVKLCISWFLISGNEVTEFQSFYLTKSKFLQTQIFTKIPSDTCNSQPHSCASNALCASFHNEGSGTQASVIIIICL